MARKRKVKAPKKSAAHVASVAYEGDELEYASLESAGSGNISENYFSLSVFDYARSQQQLRNEIYQNKAVPPIDVNACPNCGSTNTVLSGKQTRSLDEGGTPGAECRQCGYKWRPD